MSETPSALPAFTYWPTFPFEGDLKVKKLQDPVEVEPPRHGDDPAECRACSAPDEAYVWVSERWRVRSLDRPTGLPAVLILESRTHLDLGDLPNMLAAELGVMTVRLERAIRSLDGVARVHVNRWGDGAAHLHLWFLARPYGRLQLQGTFLALWDDILPPIPEARWRENLALVAAWLAEFGGKALAEPPRIEWKAPAKIGEAGDLAGIDADADTGQIPDVSAEPAAAGQSVAGDAGSHAGGEKEGADVAAAAGEATAPPTAAEIPAAGQEKPPAAEKEAEKEAEEKPAAGAEQAAGAEKPSAGNGNGGQPVSGEAGDKAAVSAADRPGPG